MNCLHRFSLIFLVTGAGWAQAVPPAVKATGNGAVQAIPDQARIEIGVLTQASTAQAAASQNAAQVQAALDKLKAALGSKAEIRTTSYSLNPVYQYSKTGGKPTIDGYSASNTVQVTCNDLSIVGKAIDAATSGGANQINRLQYSLKDEAPARARALRQAALEARSNAEAMAAALGLKLGRVLLVEQNSGAARPVMMQMRAETAAATPVQPGTIEVDATVTLTVAVE
jgi:uncharacterized protein